MALKQDLAEAERRLTMFKLYAADLQRRQCRVPEKQERKKGPGGNVMLCFEWRDRRRPWAERTSGEEKDGEEKKETTTHSAQFRASGLETRSREALIFRSRADGHGRLGMDAYPAKTPNFPIVTLTNFSTPAGGSGS